MTSQQPNNNLDNTADNAASKNRTITILASTLAVIAVMAVALLAWSYFADDSNNDNDAAATSSTTTVTSEEDPAQTFTDTSVVAPPEQNTATVTNTVEQTVEQTVAPTEPTTTGDPNAPGPPTQLPADACEATKFQNAGHDFVDTVMFCDEGWARGGQAQTDYVRNFQWNNGRWDVYPAAGESITTGYLCYDTETMARAGAPRVMLMEVLDCEYSN